MMSVFPFLLVANISVVHSTYSSALTENHPTYHEEGSSASQNFFYETIKITVNTAGYYAFRSDSTMDTYGYLYNNSFDPIFLDINRLYSDDSEGGNDQFLLSGILHRMNDYIVVATTNSPLVTGLFSILAIGPDSVNFSLTNMTGE